jgi:hypothetical protein
MNPTIQEAEEFLLSVHNDYKEDETKGRKKAKKLSQRLFELSTAELSCEDAWNREFGMNYLAVVAYDPWY